MPLTPTPANRPTGNLPPEGYVINAAGEVVPDLARMGIARPAAVPVAPRMEPAPPGLASPGGVPPGGGNPGGVMAPPPPPGAQSDWSRRLHQRMANEGIGDPYGFGRFVQARGIAPTGPDAQPFPERNPAAPVFPWAAGGGAPPPDPASIDPAALAGGGIPPRAPAQVPAMMGPNGGLPAPPYAPANLGRTRLNRFRGY